MSLPSAKRQAKEPRSEKKQNGSQLQRGKEKGKKGEAKKSNSPQMTFCNLFGASNLEAEDPSRSAWEKPTILAVNWGRVLKQNLWAKSGSEARRG